MKQFIVINAETANKCQAGSGGSLGAPSLIWHSVFIVLFIVLPGSLGGLPESMWEATGQVFCCSIETNTGTSPLQAFLRVEGERWTHPRHRHCYSCHSYFNFPTWKWQVTRPSPLRYGPCGVVIAFLDDFLFKSAVLLIFQMK